MSEQQNAMMRDHIVSMGRNHARLRVLLVLENIVRRLPLGANGPIIVPMTQVQLADHAGMTHIHFNRVVGELARQSIVQTNRGGILIKNTDTLRAAVHA